MHFVAKNNTARQLENTNHKLQLAGQLTGDRTNNTGGKSSIKKGNPKGCP
jgi:hypothetical protein